jgi:hypothetical protein
MTREPGRRRWRGEPWTPRSRAMGCVIWLLAVVVVLLLLSLLFGGFQTGTKVGSGLGPVQRSQIDAGQGRFAH